MTDADLFEDPENWANTKPDIQRIKDDLADADRPLEEFYNVQSNYPADTYSGEHRRRRGFPTPALGLIIAAAIVGSGIVGYVSHHPAKPAPVTNVTTTLLPKPTATRTKTVRLPGPAVTRHLRSTVTARATRTVPGPRVTVTVTPSTISAPKTADHG